ncbi:MAG: PRC-barrel domain-containing protein [Eggerthellaceae bacterium]|nr:PRC-barrel domain-containing protein [Eggerthellaceae bacterium]
MASKSYSTFDLSELRVYGGKKQSKFLGKVRSFVFYPKEKKIAGFIVKRPDFLLMFHRPNMFVAIDGFFLEEKHVILNNEPDTVGKAAIKRLKLDWDRSVMWVGMPVLTESGKVLGKVRAVNFSASTGRIINVEVIKSAAGSTIMGKLFIPADKVKGFKIGQGVAITEYGNPDEIEEENEVLGAIIVDEEVAEMETEGGFAEKAGQATAIAGHKVKKATAAAKPVAKKAVAATGKAINKGAYFTGQQIGKTKRMFSDFADEFRKANK